jgi:hypothetical protein
VLFHFWGYLINYNTKIQQFDCAIVAASPKQTLTPSGKLGKQRQKSYKDAAGERSRSKELKKHSVILNAEDNVILNVGELITRGALRQAEASGCLNI